ncbi:copper amine oxidase [Microbacterium sp. 2MCAF23]|uniref:copper amine oxidase n=1 Tax=Microbacterium sp. 2MCAF23 TaxID=3232985 RepID=UPI003F9E0E12
MMRTAARTTSSAQRGHFVSAGIICVLLLLAACTGAPPHTSTTRSATSAPCTTPAAEIGTGGKTGPAERLTRTLSSGAVWDLCWNVDPKRGLMLSDIRLTPPGEKPIRIISSLSLSQLEVPYDTGDSTTHDITEAGFGGTKMLALDATSCPGDKLATAIPDIDDGAYGKTRTREVLCSEQVDAGLAFHSSAWATQPKADARRTDWRLSTLSRVGWYEYVTQYTFGADGSIAVQLGATGDLSPNDFTDADHGSDVGDHEYAASHSHNAVWRVHWALDGTGGLAVQQYDATPTGADGAKAPVLAGTLTPIPHPALAQWQDRRWWQVLNPAVTNRDGHPISYQIELARTDEFVFSDDHRHGATAGYDVAFTDFDACQRYATKNSADCGGGVRDFVERNTTRALSDVVSWVAVGFHHVPRDEDQSPMELHWQGFSLLPRDLTATRFDAPPGYDDRNGHYDSPWKTPAPTP